MENEEFIRLYLDEKQDVDPPTFHAKNKSMSVSQFANIIKNYMIKYMNPLITAAAVPSLDILMMQPDALHSKLKTMRKEEAQQAASGTGSAEPGTEITTAAIKFNHARRIFGFLTPFEQTVFARLLVHITALHFRACYNGLDWKAIGRAFAFLMRSISPSEQVVAIYNAKFLEFFASNIDQLVSKDSLQLLAEMAGNDIDYGVVKLSSLSKESFVKSKYRLFPGSPIAPLMALVRTKSRMMKGKRRNATHDSNDAMLVKYQWADPNLL